MSVSNSSEYEENAFEGGLKEDDPTYEDWTEIKCDNMCNILNKIDDIVSLYGLIPLCIIGIIFNFASIGALFNNKLHLRRSLIQLFIFLNISDVLFLVCFFLSFCMPVISKTYQKEAESLLPYILPLLQTFLTVSVYSTVAITLHGLHEIQKSTKMTAPISSPVPSNVNELTEYQSVVSATGNTSMIAVQEIPYKFPNMCDSTDAIPTSSSNNNWSSNNLYEECTCFSFSKYLRNWGTRITMILVLAFSFGFNSPRWLEWEHYLEYPIEPMNRRHEEAGINMTSYTKTNHSELVETALNDTLLDARNRTVEFFEHQETKSLIKIRPSSLKKDENYYLHYQLIGSCIVMILIPAAILLKAYCSFRRATPSRSNKNKTHKIMLIIITMFILCHSPKVIITAYEIFSEKHKEWHRVAPWVRILKQVSQLLLVAYSALNPVAYCGELVYQLCYRKFLKKCGFKNKFPSFLACCCCSKSVNSSEQSELDMMKSVGITLNGADPIQQQLEELDLQSRILSGLPISRTSSLDAAKRVY